MKKSALLVLVLTLCLSASVSAVFRFGLDAGYSYASMDDLKNGLTTMKESAINGGKDASFTTFGNSVYANVCFDFGVNNNISIGPKTGAQVVLPTSITIADMLNNTKETYAAVLVPVMLGANFHIKVPLTFLSFTVGAYGGYGVAFATKSINTSEPLTDTSSITSYSSVYQGGGIMGEAVSAVEFYLADMFTLSVNLGYRYAKYDNLKAVDEIKVGNTVFVPKGSIISDGLGGTRTVDYSGINAGVGINLRF